VNIAPRPTERKGLVLFPSRDSRAVRRRKGLLALLVVVAAVCLNWPVYPWFAGIYPQILGLPLSFVWVILWQGVVFLALAWLYRTEGKGEG
jgi:hypothetical protein